MSSRPVSRRTVLLGGGITTIALAAAGTRVWPIRAHDGEDHDATPAVSTPAAGTPGADERHMREGDSGVGGLYLTITNAGTEPDALLGGTTAVCQAVEPHAMRMDGNVMVMTYLPDGLPIPASGGITLTPDGDHLMLVGLTQDLRPDTTFAISLTFQRAGAAEIVSSVRWTLDPEDLDGLAPPVTIGDLTIETVWSRPAPMISLATEPTDGSATPIAGRQGG